MKFSSQEEFGLRCLLRIAQSKSQNGMTIPEIASMESLSQANAAKILRVLRLGGFIDSSRGQAGGYKLTRSPHDILISEALEVLGGKLYESNFCDDHAGINSICTHTIDCSLRSLWKAIQTAVDSVTSNFTLSDLMAKEDEVTNLVKLILEENLSDAGVKK